MIFTDYGQMVAGLDADIAASPFALHLVNPVAVALNEGHF